MDDKYGQAAWDVKGEEPVEKGQAEPAQAPGAKRKLTGQDLLQRKRRLLLSPQPRKLSQVEIVTEAMKRRRMKRKRRRKKLPQQSSQRRQ